MPEQTKTLGMDVMSSKKAYNLPTGETKVAAVREMFDTIAPRYDLLNRIVSLGLDQGWRRTTVRSLGLISGAKVLDVACGTGDLCTELVSQGYEPVGIDMSRGMLAHAHRDVEASLVHGDALQMPFPSASFDGVVSGFALRNVTELSVLFSELARVVRPGGRIALLEVTKPESPILRLGHSIWLGAMVPLLGAVLSNGAAYRYLPESVAYLPPAHEMIEMLKDSGFRAIERSLLTFEAAQLYTATRQTSDL